MNDLFVANTILKQIQALGRIEMMSWGSHAFKGFTDKHSEVFGLGPTLGGLIFKVQGYLFKGHVAVVLMPNDTYTVMFGKLRKNSFTRDKDKPLVEDVYFDELVPVIDRNVETTDNYKDIQNELN